MSSHYSGTLCHVKRCNLQRLVAEGTARDSGSDDDSVARKLDMSVRNLGFPNNLSDDSLGNCDHGRHSILFSVQHMLRIFC
jgi:hypothetical protein